MPKSKCHEVCCVCGGAFSSHVDGKPYCNRHYQLARKYGVPEGRPRKRTCSYILDGDIMQVVTQKGDVILADAADREAIMRYSWCVSKTGYAVANIRGKVTKMHRYILGEDVCAGMIVDHKNRNPLDNRRENLRVCSAAENMRNTPVRRTNKSGHLGIRVTKDGKFNVRIVADGVEHHVGNYDTLELAISARNEAEDEYHGEYASHRSKI